MFALSCFSCDGPITGENHSEIVLIIELNYLLNRYKLLATIESFARHSSISLNNRITL